MTRGLILVSGLWLAATAETCGAAAAPGFGTIVVTSSTTGVSIDPNGYTVTLDAGRTSNLAVNDSVTFTGSTPGSHLVLLSDLASNCSVGGGNPTTVVVQPATTAHVAFRVVCIAT